MLKRSMFTLLLCSLSLATAAQFKNESEVSVVVNGGNTDVQVYNAKTTNTYTSGKNIYTLGGHYMYGTTSDVMSSRNWDLNTRYERSISNLFGTFLGAVYEGDEFAGIDNRTNIDLGGTFHILNKEKTKATLEAGARYRMEESVSGAEVKQTQARLYGVIGHKSSEQVEVKFWAEYLPNFTESDDWQINFAPSFQYNFHTNLALKWSYVGKYDNLPIAGLKKFDFQYTTSIIANF